MVNNLFAWEKTVITKSTLVWSLLGMHGDVEQAECLGNGCLCFGRCYIFIDWVSNIFF
jgi:hypothetical protein